MLIVEFLEVGVELFGEETGVLFKIFEVEVFQGWIWEEPVLLLLSLILTDQGKDPWRLPLEVDYDGLGEGEQGGQLLLQGFDLILRAHQ